jgi:hypothetical protein
VAQRLMDLLSHPRTPFPYVAFFRRSHKGFEAFTGKTCWSDGAPSVWNLLFPLLQDAFEIHGTVTPPE